MFFFLGGASFQLPNDLGELQEILGGEGACVSIGYSLITEEGLMKNNFY